MTVATREYQPRTYRMEDHRGWGNTIEWGWGEAEGKIIGRRVQGCLRQRPNVGDFLLAELQDGQICRFVFTEVMLERNPPDLFFGKVDFVDIEMVIV